MLFVDLCSHVCFYDPLTMFGEFFFFKQKTAYEMRISDWSSDVCSSDLAPAAFRPEPRAVEPAAVDQDRRLSGGLQVLSAILALRYRPRGEIGRASCRERVCQYV